MNNDLKEIYIFLKSKIPIILDMEKEKLKYDTNNIYFKIYKYIYDNEERKRK